MKWFYLALVALVLSSIVYFYIPIFYNDRLISGAFVNFKTEVLPVLKNKDFSIIEVHHKLYGPYSSNSCNPFMGFMFESSRSFESLKERFQPYWIAQLKEGMVDSNGVEKPTSIDCLTCFSPGLRNLFLKAEKPDEKVLYIVYSVSVPGLDDSDVRCH